MSDEGFDVVTGAFGYTGGAIARELLRTGRRVRTLTGHPARPGANRSVEVLPYAFDDPDALARSLEGADTLYNTYWIRFDRGDERFERAVDRSGRLFHAAERAGVRRVVHVSVTNPDAASPFPYFRGKALVEQALASTCDSWAVVRPTVVFGPGDILVNNIAWLLRRFPVFAVPGDGTYRVRPVHVEDVAELCVELASGVGSTTVDAVGPDTLTFDGLVERIRDGVGARCRIVHVHPRMAALAASAIGLVVRDVLVTDHELGGLMSEKAYSDAPTTGRVRFAEWLRDAGPTLGRRYASEIERHFRQ
jgi:NADH dehydrogenase